MFDASLTFFEFARIQYSTHLFLISLAWSNLLQSLDPKIPLHRLFMARALLDQIKNVFKPHYPFFFGVATLSHLARCIPSLYFLRVHRKLNTLYQILCNMNFGILQEKTSKLECS